MWPPVARVAAAIFLGRLALVETLGAARGDLFERRGEVGLRQSFAAPHTCPSGWKKIFRLDSHRPRSRAAAGSESARSSETPRPFAASRIAGCSTSGEREFPRSPFGERMVQARHRAGNADAEAGVVRFRGIGVAGGVQEHVGRRRRRSDLAIIEGDLPAFLPGCTSMKPPPPRFPARRVTPARIPVATAASMALLPRFMKSRPIRRPAPPAPHHAVTGEDRQTREELAMIGGSAVRPAPNRPEREARRQTRESEGPTSPFVLQILCHLGRILRRSDGTITDAAATNSQRRRAMSEPAADLFAAACAARACICAPFRIAVGAAVRGASARFFAGCNVENAAYPAGTCAEAGAIAAAVAAGEEDRRGARHGRSDEPVTPCGACRQRLREFASDDLPVHSAGAAGVVATFHLETCCRARSPQHLPNAIREIDP